MWQNILVILLIIGLSYLFRQTSSNLNNKVNTFDAQMLFILLSLGGIVFYKMIYLKSMMKKDKEILVVNNEEGFINTSFNKELNTFSSLSGDISGDSNKDNSDLKKTVNELKEKVELLQSNNSNVPTIKSTIQGELNSDEIQIKQNNDLQELEYKLKDLIQAKTLEGNLENEKDFKKIPVYNSCYNADGTFHKKEEKVSKQELLDLKNTYNAILQKLETNNINIDFNIDEDK